MLNDKQKEQISERIGRSLTESQNRQGCFATLKTGEKVYCAIVLESGNKHLPGCRFEGYIKKKRRKKINHKDKNTHQGLKKQHLTIPNNIPEKFLEGGL